VNPEPTLNQKVKKISVDDPSSAKPRDFGNLLDWQQISEWAKEVFLHSVTLRNLSYLYAIQIATYILPLLTFPYLARVLQPEGFGKLAVAQSVAHYLYLVLEFGFPLSATREVAMVRDQTHALRDILKGVWGARLILIAPVSFAAYLVWVFFPSLQGEDELVLGAFLYALGLVLSPIWFFQGLEKMALVAGLEFFIRLFATGSIFLTVRNPSDVAMPLYLHAGSSFLVGVIGILLVFQHVGFTTPALSGGWRWLGKGLSLFFFRTVVSLYTGANVLIVSLLLPNAQVALYAGAEKTVKALIPLWEPFNRLFLPRFSFLLHHNPLSARRLAAKVIFVMLGIGLSTAALLWALAPWLVKVLFGESYSEAIPLIRILALVLPLIALSNFLGIQWMLAQKMDNPFNVIISLAGIFNVIFAWVLIPRFGLIGMAWSVLLAEAWVTLAITGYLWWTRHLPRRSYEV